MDESRKAFEQWAQGMMEFAPDDLTWDEERNCYRDYVPHMAWKGWQASRAAIEIKLPPKAESSPYEHYMPHYTMDAESVESAIRAAGIKVKE